MLSYIEFSGEMLDELVQFLTAEPWEFHGQVHPTEESIRNAYHKGVYSAEGTRTFWIADGTDTIGLIRLFDLEDPTCVFDIRLIHRARGQGIGKAALTWITDFVFNEYPEIIRIEGHTRHDNLAMRKAFAASRFVKEAYHRQAWRQGGKLYDSVGYAVTREDWENGIKTEVQDIYVF